MVSSKCFLQCLINFLCSLLILYRKALLLGSGFVTKPTVQILADAGVEVTVGRVYLHLFCSSANA